MNNNKKSENALSLDTLHEIISAQGLDICDVLIVGLQAFRSLKRKTKAPILAAQRLIYEGAEILQQKEKSVSFGHAVKASLNSKDFRRSRTIKDIQYISNVFLKNTPPLAAKQLCTMSTEYCTKLINQCFNTPRQRYKGRLILHGIFSLAQKRGWCQENPVSRVDVPRCKEKQIMCLNLRQVQKLLHATETTAQGECMAAVGLMLYAGIRPQEVQRLEWQHINLQQSFISIPPTHSKTGGARHVTIEPILHKLLKKVEKNKPNAKICPPNWLKKWREVRQAAGWNKKTPWIQDCLRHSYASFHAIYYKNFNRLQYELGHSSSSLLRTRYLNMQGITLAQAKQFWGEQRNKHEESPTPQIDA